MAKSSASTDPKDIFVARDGLSIHALDWGGTGPPLLLLPPNGFCAGFFDPLAQRLRDDFRVIAVDLRGQGLTDTPQDFSSGLTFFEMAADVIAVLDELEIKQCDALGESLGGGVAVQTPEEVLADPQVLAGGGFVDVPDGSGTTTMINSPIDYLGTPGGPRSMPPYLGEHTDSVLASLGYSSDEISKLRLSGVIA